MSRLILLVCFALFFGMTHADTGKVANSSGAVLVNGFPVKDHQRIQAGDQIVTGEKSHVTIVMSDRSVIDLKAKTRFKLDKYSFNKNEPEKGSSLMNLLSGGFRYISGLVGRSNPKNASIRMGTVTAGIRGSFVVFSTDGTKSSVQTEKGSAEMVFPDGSRLTVNNGQTGVLRGGKGSVDKTITPDNVFTSLQRLKNGNDLNKTLTDAESALLVMALINEGPTMSPPMSSADIRAAVKKVVKANPDAGPLIAVAVVAVTDNDDNPSTDNLIKDIKDADPNDDDTAIDKAKEEAEKEEEKGELTSTAVVGAGGGDGKSSVANP